MVFFFKNSGFFSSKLGGFFFRTLVSLKKTVFFFKIQLKQCACHITVDHDCWLKENEQNGVDDQNGFICFLFILCLSCGTNLMPPYIPVTSGNCDRYSSIKCYFNLD